MIWTHVDGVTVYNSRLNDHALLGLKVTTGVNKGGTAEITMPPGHPGYNSFVSYRSIVEISRDNELLFRGRALYPTDDAYNCRTITCEGERCFLQDAVMRPYLYQDTPAAIFADVIGIYNTQVEEPKQFQVGTVTVTDANDYVRLESENATQVSDAIDKLVERCGGYIVFTTNSDGRRVINWYAELGYQSSQVIKFGENLLDFSRTQASTDLATRIIPYGAKDEETGERVTIESENGGLDFVEDADAVALRGVIAKPVYWDDVTEPANLLAKAQKYLAASKMLITSLELTAVDLSILDKDIDSLRVGDLVQVKSQPHGVDDSFLLRERTYNLLDPAQDKVVLGKELSTLTGAGVAGDRDALSQLDRTKQIIRADYTLNTEQAIAATETTLASLIEQTATEIRTEVSETYATNDQVKEYVGTELTQTKEGWDFSFNELKVTVDENDAEHREQFETIHKYIRFVDGNIILGEAGNELTLRIQNDRISFLDGGAEVAYFSNKQLHVRDGRFLNSLTIGKFAFIPRENGNLSLVKTQYTALEITSQPQNIELADGGIFEFTITASGDELSYLWQTSDSPSGEWTDNGTDSTYDMHWAPSSDSYKYVRCIVTDKYGNSITSRVATAHAIKAATELVITSQPQDMEIAGGGIFEFTITASGDGLSYLWQTSTSSSGEWTDVGADGTGSTYELWWVTTSDSYKYVRCIVTDKYGNSVTSRVATAHASKAATGTGPVITSQPQDVEKAGTGIFSFSITASGDGLSYLWQTSDSPDGGWNNQSQTTSTYMLYMSTSNTYKYVRCIVTDAAGNSVTSRVATAHSTAS